MPPDTAERAALCVLQGHKARSYIEYSLLKKYHLFLCVFRYARLADARRIIKCAPRS